MIVYTVPAELGPSLYRFRTLLSFGLFVLKRMRYPIRVSPFVHFAALLMIRELDEMTLTVKVFLRGKGKEKG